MYPGELQFRIAERFAPDDQRTSEWLAKALGRGQYCACGTKLNEKSRALHPGRCWACARVRSTTKGRRR